MAKATKGGLRLSKATFCLRNLKRGSREIMRRLADEAPQVERRTVICLDRCDICIEQPFLLWQKKEWLMAETVEQLWEMIEKRI